MAESEKYKVLIPTAGIGSRLGNHCDHVNKTLVPVANRPILSYIIEKFPEDVEIIIDLGYKGELVKEFLTLAYPNRNFTFVWAKQRGLTADLYDYRDMLQCPFIFFTNDAIVSEAIPEPDHDWVGYADVNAAQDYRSVVLDSWDKTVVKNIAEKGIHTEAKAYIGICGIHNYRVFWANMEKAINDGTANQGEAFALAIMVKANTVAGHQFTWYDTGTIESLAYANNAFKKPDDPNILPKTTEHIWFCNNRVIKFSVDQDFIRDRVNRAKLLAGYVPDVEDSTANMYTYYQVDGQVLSSTITVPRFKDFLSWVEGLWGPQQQLTPEEQEAYIRFYKDKTFNRIQAYFSRFNRRDVAQCINGVDVPKLSDILHIIDWNWISSGIPIRFHGDLHFENILDTEDDFCGLDWRQNFGGLDEYGDAYYDLAKIWHGLIVSHGLINHELYDVDIDGDNVHFELLRKQVLVDCEQYLRSYLVDNNYDCHKTEILTALIYLNIAALHHQPYADMLFHLGKLMLYNLVGTQKG